MVSECGVLYMSGLLQGNLFIPTFSTGHQSRPGITCVGVFFKCQYESEGREGGREGVRKEGGERLG